MAISPVSQTTKPQVISHSSSHDKTVKTVRPLFILLMSASMLTVTMAQETGIAPTDSEQAKHKRVVALTLWVWFMLGLIACVCCSSERRRY